MPDDARGRGTAEVLVVGQCDEVAEVSQVHVRLRRGIDPLRPGSLPRYAQPINRIGCIHWPRE